MSQRRFEGQVMAVTGAARGIGAALARRLTREGATIAAVDRDAEGLNALHAELSALGRAPIIASFDTRSSDETDRFFARVQGECSRLDGLVPAAGITRHNRAEEMTDAQWDEVMGVNVTGVFYACRAAARLMLPRGKGAIVLLASLTAKGGQPGRINYAASKWAIAGMTKSLATEWGHRGIRTNAVAPNGVDTPMIRDGIPGDFLDAVMLDRTPLGRLGTADEIASAIAFLMSDEAAYVNGAVLEVDGGVTAGYMTSRHGADFGSFSIPNRIKDQP